ncbi:hypothetical protein [Paenibacillus crassostreae]|uniref:Uncharacterized protein n=1 Tax=Paenibacillus crassostreae TaxID=1763538 RepID=A0A167AG65_9BACL|nr:hypothetical protein [Paenibacillus crassostreae]AOZ92267.1 hypothetical protein LPB68_08540 [Paenibacillus crassostreae]OAB70984.1 hypothetical protein PNBC_20690 [Paenibacillus crassostreae]
MRPAWALSIGVSPECGQGYVFEISEGRVLILDNVKEGDFGKGWKDVFEDLERIKRIRTIV